MRATAPRGNWSLLKAGHCRHWSERDQAGSATASRLPIHKKNADPACLQCKLHPKASLEASLLALQPMSMRLDTCGVHALARFDIYSTCASKNACNYRSARVGLCKENPIANPGPGATCSGALGVILLDRPKTVDGTLWRLNIFGIKVLLLPELQTVPGLIAACKASFPNFFNPDTGTLGLDSAEEILVRLGMDIQMRLPTAYNLALRRLEDVSEPFVARIIRHEQARKTWHQGIQEAALA